MFSFLSLIFCFQISLLFSKMLLEILSSSFYYFRYSWQFCSISILMTSFVPNWTSKCNLAPAGSKEDLIPPMPILTRYKKEHGIKAFVKKEVTDFSLLDERRSNEINLLSTSKLCVRLNTLHVSLLSYLFLNTIYWVFTFYSRLRFESYEWFFLEMLILWWVCLLILIMKDLMVLTVCS